jgi:hypothetical protein
VSSPNSGGLAPIAFFVYNRPRHTKRALEALAANPLASESDLFIFSDAPKNEQAEEGVRAVREYIHTVKGFKSITIREHEQNHGLVESLISGISDLCDRFGRVIVVEDDILTSSCFLQFMNDSLEKYKDNERVFSVSGFWPVKPKRGENRAFFLNNCLIWGLGTWKRAWDLYDRNAAGWEELLKNKRLAWDFDANGRIYFMQMLVSQFKDEFTDWSLPLSWIIYREKKLCLHPPYSLTTNIGFDTGVHATVPGAGEWHVQNIDLNLAEAGRAILLPEKVELDRKKLSALGNFYSSVFRKRGWNFLLRGLFWIFYRPLRRLLLYVPHTFLLKHNFPL